VAEKPKPKSKKPTRESDDRALNKVGKKGPSELAKFLGLGKKK
jgi:hypothetical protein